jgi:DNA-binding GntR family transcriptional regulator
MRSLRERTKTDSVYEEIKKLILRGELSSDTPISENYLAQRFGISRTPIREALKRLDMEGFVRIIPNQGVFVRDVSISEVKEIYDLRIALEEFVVKELTHTLSEDDLFVLEGNLARQEEALRRHDAFAFHEEDRKFHDYFMKAYGNDMITDFITNLRDRIEGINVNMLKQPGNMELFWGEHRRILEALRRRDGEGATREMDEHLKGGKERLLRG